MKKCSNLTLDSIAKMLYLQFSNRMSDSIEHVDHDQEVLVLSKQQSGVFLT